MMMDDSNEKGKEISLSFINFKNDLLDKNCKFFENDMGYKLFDKILPDYHWNLIKFTNNEKKIHPFITIKENGIKDGSIIKSCFAINIHFLSTNGKTINIAVDENYPIKKPIKYYLLRIGKEGCFRDFIFLYNSIKLDIEDKTPIKNIFKQNKHPIIQVHY